ncbi:hypothetical protein K9N68_05095 [Kovacikia minuta CCNUW1]|uniref:hypothetical protein n=1 Tax=Kovacikia minuta TaxID=2931930 RepID=UPI001CCC1DFC|nr:hypothetical protein [Kovacikia minuta]UBF27336.1 hypothetical protein K9N68_05095 [Kovacikia minuta CCNUW1]
MANLSGSWLGTYWQEGIPTRFEATLVQSGNSLSGSILDDSDLGEAQVAGEVIGRSVGFNKRYLTTSPHPVNYTGTVSEDENSMQGTWKVGSYTGTWEAHRGGDDLMAELQNQLTKQLSVTGAGSR